MFLDHAGLKYVIAIQNGIGLCNQEVSEYWTHPCLALTDPIFEFRKVGIDLRTRYPRSLGEILDWMLDSLSLEELGNDVEELHIRLPFFSFRFAFSFRDHESNLTR